MHGKRLAAQLEAELLRTAETEFTDAGCTIVSPQVGKENGVARSFYERRGYVTRSGFGLLEKMFPAAGGHRRRSLSR